MPAKSEKQQKHAGKFKKGQSGNPKGRPAGSRNKATLAIESILDGQAEALTQKAIDLALAGDSTALRLCLERLCPPRKDRPLNSDAIRLPPLKADRLAEASAAVVRAVAGGRLTPQEGEALGKLLEGHRRAVELVELEQRVSKLERHGGTK